MGTSVNGTVRMEVEAIAAGERWVKVSTAAKLVDASVWTVHKAIRDQRLTARRWNGGAKRVRVDDVLALLGE